MEKNQVQNCSSNASTNGPAHKPSSSPTSLSSRKNPVEAALPPPPAATKFCSPFPPTNASPGANSPSLRLPPRQAKVIPSPSPSSHTLQYLESRSRLGIQFRYRDLCSPPPPPPLPPSFFAPSLLKQGQRLAGRTERAVALFEFDTDRTAVGSSGSGVLLTFTSLSRFCYKQGTLSVDCHLATMSVDLAHRIVSSLRRSARCKNTHVIYNDDYEEDFGDERSDEEVDLDEPLIALKQKKEKISSRKAKRKTDTSSSPHATILGTSPKRDEISPVQTFQFKSALHDSTTEKLERRAVDQEHSGIAIEHAEERAGEDIFCAEMENAVFHTCDHLSVVPHQFPIEDNGCGQQPGFITQPTEPDVSDAKAHLHSSVEQKKTDSIFSSLVPIDEVIDHQKYLDDTSNSDVNKSSVGNELLISSVNRPRDDHTDNNEFRYPEVVQTNTPERIKTMEESSPIDDFNTDMRCTSVVMQPDSCESTNRIYTEHEDVVQMPVEGQLDSLACHGVKTKDILVHMNFEQAATGYNFAFDKTLDLAHTANFDNQDGRLENIVYGALNNNVQRKCSVTKTSVGVPDTVVIMSSPTAANVSHDGQLSGTMNVVNDQEPREAYVVQQELVQACVNMGKTGCARSDSSSNPEETQEISAGASISTPTCLGTDGQTMASDFFIDEGSISDHTPKKLFSQRKIMSPTSQEKFCNALAGIDLCGIQRLERKINLKDCDASSEALPQTTNKQGRSILTRDRKLKSRTSVSFASKGVAKSTESPSLQLTSSSVLLDSEKAVEFSQRQMHDIESIAANLIRSLKHMRSLVDVKLSSETHSLLPNFNTAEMRAASEDALKVERTTRKWLTIMNKDCNRFCKILTQEGNKAVSHPEVPRKRRKIMFADEAGGTLCHVNVFSDVHTSPSACQGEL